MYLELRSFSGQKQSQATTWSVAWLWKDFPISSESFPSCWSSRVVVLNTWHLNESLHHLKSCNEYKRMKLGEWSICDDLRFSLGGKKLKRLLPDVASDGAKTRRGSPSTSESFLGQSQHLLQPPKGIGLQFLVSRENSEFRAVSFHFSTYPKVRGYLWILVLFAKR